MSPFPYAGRSGEDAAETDIEGDGVEIRVVGRPTAISPGRITRKGNNILGIAAIRGVRRAALIESAAMARCTTRKSVHQYPNESTNPSPITSPNHSTPSRLVCGLAMPTQEWV